jgi:hypothetical protein
MRVENSSGSPPDALPYKISRILGGSLVRRVHGSLMIHYLAVVWWWYQQERRVMVVAQ